MNSIMQFRDSENGYSVRTVKINSECWFVAKDVCDILEIENSRHAVSRLDDDEKNTVALNDGTSGNPNQTVVSESGLFALILRSNKPNARAYRKWVTSVVLPALHRGESVQGVPMTIAMRRLQKQKLLIKQSELLVDLEEVRNELEALRESGNLPGHLSVQEWMEENGLDLNHTNRCKIGYQLARDSDQGKITQGEKSVPVKNKARVRRLFTYPPEAIAATYAELFPAQIEG